MDPSSCRQHRIRHKYALASERRAHLHYYLPAADWPASYIALPLLRAAVKFSTLQSYEFVAANAIITVGYRRTIRCHCSFSFFFFYAVSSILFPCFTRFHALRRRRLVWRDYIALYDTRYPLSEILCPASGSRICVDRHAHVNTYTYTYTHRIPIESLVNFNFAN